MVAAALLLVLGEASEQMLVTQEYADFLRRHVSWEVVDYEDNVFRGWTVDEFRSTLMQKEDATGDDEERHTLVLKHAENALPTLDWKKLRADCIHPIRDQGDCGSCWAFSAASVVSDRCCLRLRDHGWLSPQELVSCDRYGAGCTGGFQNVALNYVANNGLVSESCFPYQAKTLICPMKCTDGTNWAAAHVCKCKEKVFCDGPEGMKACLQTGPVTAGMWVYKDFVYYKGGIYHWSKVGTKEGNHAVRCYGYSDKPEFHWMCANSWGTGWGEQGFFRIGKGEVGIDSQAPAYCDPY